MDNTRRKVIKGLLLGGVLLAGGAKILDNERLLRQCLAKSEELYRKRIGGRELSPYEKHQAELECVGKERR